MKQTYFTVGPSQLFPTVQHHLAEAIEQQIGSISHRSGKFEEIFSSTVTNLKKLLSIPENYSIFFLSSGTEAMERTIENVVEKHSLHFVNGAFSQRFFDTAIELGKQAKKIEVPLGEGFKLGEQKEREGWQGGKAADGAQPRLNRGSTDGKEPLTGPRAKSLERQDPNISKTTELLCFTHNETSTGVMLPATHIASIKKQYPDKLVAIDTVSSAPYGAIDYKHVDIVFFSVQKLFGLPAGLGVMVVSPQALEKAAYLQKKGVNIGTYHNFPTLKKWADKHQTPETPSVLHIFLLNKILEDMLKIGIGQIRKDTEEKAKLLYDFFEKYPRWKPFVKDGAFRSPTVIVANVGTDQKELKTYLKEHGMIVGDGYGPAKDTQIRIANFPALSKTNIETLITMLKNFTR